MSLSFKHIISHKWERAQHLKEYRAGLVVRSELCDADFLLCAAAEHHGVDMAKRCPMCEAPMRLTTWVYGAELGRRAGSARNAEEIAEFAADGLEFTVHWVEVCTACRWNHLLRAATAYDEG